MIKITNTRLKRIIGLILFVDLMMGFQSKAQLLQWNTFGNAGTETSEPGVFNNSNIAASNLTLSAGVTPAGNTNRFGGSNWFNTGDNNPNTIANAISGNDYIQFIVTPNAGFSFTPTSFVFNWDKSGTGPQNVTLRSSADGFATDLGTITGIVTNAFATNTITISGLIALTTATTFRIYGYGATATTGTGGFDIGSNIVNVQLNGTTAATCTAPAGASGTITPTANPSCGTTTLSFPASVVLNVIYYWQTSASGTDMTTATNGAANYTVNTTGTYYVRAYNIVTSCWSTATPPLLLVTINSAPAITTQPPNQSVTSPAAAPFTVMASGTGIGYQWQYYNGSTWINLTNTSPYSGVTTATLTISPANITLNNTQYRCVVSGTAPCSAVTSNAATLTVIYGTTNTDYFRSNVAAGNWSTAASWQSSFDNLTWYTATAAPTSNAKAITIRNGHEISITTSGVSMTAATIQNGGTLLISSINFYSIGGSGNQLTVESGGQIHVNVAGLIASPSGTGSVLVKSGGKVIAGPLINDGTAIGNAYLRTTSKFTYENAAIFEWNNTSTALGSSAGETFFSTLSVTDLPILRISATPGFAYGSSIANNVFNCIWEANANCSFVNAGTKTIRGGFRGTASITQTGGALILPNSTSVLDGSISLNVVNDGLQFTNGAIVPLVANVKITSTPEDQRINKLSGSLLINGTLDITDLQIRNTVGTSPDITINGTIKTANKEGLYGASAAAPLSTTVTSPSTLNLNAGSTIEYNASVNQAISSSVNYYNITFSTGGTKTPNNAINVNTNGTVKITSASVIVDAGSNNIGSAATNTTNFIMDGGRLILGTSPGAGLPLMDGTYNLTGGIVQYNYNGLTTQTVRNKAYQNIEISGANVGNSTGNITLNSGGTFKVKNPGIFTINDNTITGPVGTQTVTVESGGIFKTGNNEGFHGYVATFINNSSLHENIENVVLQTGSTIEYIKTGVTPNQNITNTIPYQNLTLSGSGIKTAPSAILSVQGNLTKSGSSTFAHNSGTVSLEGTSAITQIYSATDAGMEFYKLVIKNTNGGVTVAGNMGIENLLTLNALSKLMLGAGNISIRSTVAATAAIGQIPATANLTYPGTGRFIIERYLQARKAWRLLATPIIGTQTINTGWQNGQTPGVTGPLLKGTNITGPVTGIGFDATTPGYSMKYHEMASNIFIPVTNTGSAVANEQGYMLFVRGDRSVSLTGAAGSTTLQTTGQIITGSKTFSVTANKFLSVGNPYASRIDLRTVPKSGGMVDAFTIWNPTQGGSYGVGAYVTYTKQGDGNYKNTVLEILNTIESGQAFFIQAGNTNGSLTIHETDKVTGSSNVSRIRGRDKQLRLNMYSYNASGTGYRADGVMIDFDDRYSNFYDNMDVKKPGNSTENLSIYSNDYQMVAERRQLPINTDTIHLSISGTRVQRYTFRFDVDNMHVPRLEAFLSDNYLHTNTPVNLHTGTNINFDITADAASKAVDRFAIVFKQGSKSPVILTITSSMRNRNNVAVINWSVDNETFISSYDIERSADNTVFTSIASITDVVNNGKVANFTNTDNQPVAGANYYRIKAIRTNGQIVYSNIIAIDPLSANSSIVVYPNPVADKKIHVHFTNLPEGEFHLQLTNKIGQVLYNGMAKVKGYSFIKTIQLGKITVTGIYQLKVTAQNGTVLSQELIVLN